MKGLVCQLKSVGKDKFCVMSFFLPVVAAVMLNFAGSIDLSSLGELRFGVIDGGVSSEIENWLGRYGSVMACRTKEELTAAINDPSTSLIGVEMEGNSVRTVLSGDEWAIIRQTAATLPTLYKQRDMASQARVQILKRPDILAGYQNIFSALTLVAAMFLGCTFNAMNIISEKEDGIALINEILPATIGQYIIQKIFIGFVFGCLSAAATAVICFRLSPAGAAALLIIIILSAFTAALIGLFVGGISDGLMTGIVYIKIVMIVFMAVPLLKYLTGAGNEVLSYICFLVPSSAAFEGIMELANGGTAAAGKDMVILAAHCAGWFLLCLLLSGRQKKQLFFPIQQK